MRGTPCGSNVLSDDASMWWGLQIAEISYYSNLVITEKLLRKSVVILCPRGNPGEALALCYNFEIKYWSFCRAIVIPCVYLSDMQLRSMSKVAVTISQIRHEVVRLVQDFCDLVRVRTVVWLRLKWRWFLFCRGLNKQGYKCQGMLIILSHAFSNVLYTFVNRVSSLYVVRDYDNLCKYFICPRELLCEKCMKQSSRVTS